MKISLQFSITHAEIDDLEGKIFVWVQTYEKYRAVVFSHPCVALCADHFLSGITISTRKADSVPALQ
jgi:hypothetical protein